MFVDDLEQVSAVQDLKLEYQGRGYDFYSALDKITADTPCSVSPTDGFWNTFIREVVASLRDELDRLSTQDGKTKGGKIWRKIWIAVTNFFGKK